MENEYSYWEIRYISMESNERWTTARCPADWTAYDVECRVPRGGVGDDISEVTEVLEYSPENEFDYGYDFT
jgi:hypothetical protein